MSSHAIARATAPALTLVRDDRGVLVVVEITAAELAVIVVAPAFDPVLGDERAAVHAADRQRRDARDAFDRLDHGHGLRRPQHFTVSPLIRAHRPTTSSILSRPRRQLELAEPSPHCSLPPIAVTTHHPISNTSARALGSARIRVGSTGLLSATGDGVTRFSFAGFRPFAAFPAAFGSGLTGAHGRVDATQRTSPLATRAQIAPSRSPR